MRFEECDQRREEPRIIGLVPQLLRPNSGQVEKPPGPSLVTERCRKRGEGKGYRVVLRLG